ncbi:serine dehydratase [Melissococcus plutonius]|uniref:L-serine dehydratase, beta subunit n=2 Tax=Melissococcus plutonius TaxID=33970 RepID=F3YCF8_MELPT|nr:serine dehydratase [Melissococcus plutonius]BAL61584.1 L-serine dehydratase, subunit beta [Melissococcus plutonius DAT561]AIM26000.1 L-serine dehydratase, subunit beta [Melissococcus plutonius S1]KMT23748.1 L-serine dehydratase, subunit beta [Melissococcus plutonius]KMT24108.1 L-serine dehydratase, subunit beta [Melissococcus plutonius]KMT24508.1 L-serine dehydratase, subunit beta [Melissococcus plutonius]
MKDENYHSVFDVISPGTGIKSNPNTAKFIQIGKIARAILASQPDTIDVYLYESMANITYQTTSRNFALIGGILAIDLNDSGIDNTLKAAYEKGVEVLFIQKDKHKEDHTLTTTNNSWLKISKMDQNLTIKGKLGEIENVQLVISKQKQGIELTLPLEHATTSIIYQGEINETNQLQKLLTGKKINKKELPLSHLIDDKQAIMIVKTNELDKQQIEKIRALTFVKQVLSFD